MPSQARKYMTLAAVWIDNSRLYAVADTRIVREPGNILTEHGPKLLAIGVSCKQPGSSGFFDKEVYRFIVGFAYAGATLPALCTHSLANTLFQNLIGAPGTEPPQLSDIASAIRAIGFDYMREVGELAGPRALFEAIIFGWCIATNRYRSFTLKPSLSSGQLSVAITEDNLAKDTVLIIGTEPDRLRDRISELRGKASHSVVFGDTPRRALRALIKEGGDQSIGGAVQYGCVTQSGFEPVADAVPIPPRPGRNVASLILGFDTFDLPPIGSYQVGMASRV
jgi:hypothetical protein